MIAARWIEMDCLAAGSLMLGTASLSALSYENSLTRPAIYLWNDVHHVLAECRHEGFPMDPSAKSLAA